MVNQVVKLPVLGDTTKVAVVAEWLVDVGDHIEVGTPLMSVETDKVTTDVPSPVAGPSLSVSSASRTRSPSAPPSPASRADRRRRRPAALKTT